MEVSYQSIYQDFTTEHVYVKGAIRASGCRLSSRCLESCLLSQNQGRGICEQVGAGACQSIRWGPKNGLRSLKVGDGCHCKFCGLKPPDRGFAEGIYCRLIEFSAQSGYLWPGIKCKCSLFVFVCLCFSGPRCP